MSSVHLSEFQDAIERALLKIFSEPKAGRRFYNNIRFTVEHNNIFRLLAELRVRTQNMDPISTLDPLIYFGITTLLYLYESDQDRRDELYKELEKLKEADPTFYTPLMVERDTPPLRFCA